VSEFFWRRSGSAGCEVIGPDGIIAWTANERWAAVIVEMLNGCSRSIPAHQTGGSGSVEATDIRLVVGCGPRSK